MEEAAAAAAAVGCGEQFRAAVQVIQGLPHSGSYRPSYEEMLRFYSYYKQATAGSCQGPRPGFWDPIGRYKWDAWHSLGRMSKEEAMAAYVAEMKKVAQKIIDTVPMDETTEEMFGYFEPLYEVIHDMPRPPEAFFKRKGGRREQTAQPSQEHPAPEHPEDTVPGEQQNGQPGPGGGLGPAAEGGQVTSDTEGDVFCDSLEQMELEQAGQLLALSLNCGAQVVPESPQPHGAGQGEPGEGRRLEGKSCASLTTLGPQRGLWLSGAEQDPRTPPELAQGLTLDAQGLPLDAHVAGTVRALQADMERVLERLSQLETLAAEQGDITGTEPGQLLAPQAASPWPLTVSPRTLLFLVTWPFVTQWLLQRWRGRKR